MRLWGPIDCIGSGKTLPFLLCASAFDSGKTTILILPLLSMHDEYWGRASACGLTCETWTHDSRATRAPQLLIVAVEYGGLKKLRIYIDTLIRLGALARIVTDEAHLLLKHAEFRECVDLLEHFGQLPTSIVLVTATLPRHLENRLFNKIGRRVYRVLRRPTERPEIAHTMIPLELTGLDMEKTVADRIQGLVVLNESERALLFCLSRVECDRMADLLQWKPYHADIPPATRSQYLKEWRLGKTRGLVCTSLLNCCLDFPAVRFVFHLHIPRDAVDYDQAVGRGSRDHARCESVVYFNPVNCRTITGEDDFGVAAIHDTLRDDSVCRRLRKALFLDGVATPCTMLPGGQLCDVCERQMRQPPPRNGPAHFPSHILPPESTFPSDGRSVADVDRTSSGASTGVGKQQLGIIDVTRRAAKFGREFSFLP
jgi:superfamily II DNA helicase RecQ